MMTRKSGIIYAPRYAAHYPDNARDEIKQWCIDQFGEPNLIHGRWSDIPDRCIVNLLKECGWTILPTKLTIQELDVHIRTNMNIKLAQYKASEFTDNPLSEPITYWYDIDFPDESYYTMFLLRWS